MRRLLALAALVPALAACGAYQHVTAKNDPTPVQDDAAAHEGYLGSDRFPLGATGEDVTIVGVLREGKMALLEVCLTCGAERQPADVLYFGTYQVIQGELKTRRSFTCAELRGEGAPARDFYFRVEGDAEGATRLREVSLRRILPEEQTLRLAPEWDDATLGLTEMPAARTVGCREGEAEPDAGQSAAARRVFREIEAMLRGG